MTQTQLIIHEQAMQLQMHGNDEILLIETVINHILETGVVGPQGPGGAAGDFAPFDYTQASPSSLWIINHNLGYRPDVSVRDASQNELLASVSHPSINQTRVAFASAMTGTARLL